MAVRNTFSEPTDDPTQGLMNLRRGRPPQWGVDDLGQITADGSVVIPGGADSPYQTDPHGQLLWNGGVVVPPGRPVSEAELAAAVGSQSVDPSRSLSGGASAHDSGIAMLLEGRAPEGFGTRPIDTGYTSPAAPYDPYAAANAADAEILAALGGLGDLIDAAATNASTGITGAVDDGTGRLRETADIAATRGAGAVSAQQDNTQQLLASLAGVGGEVGDITSGSGQALFDPTVAANAAQDGVSTLIPAAATLGAFMAQNQQGRNQAHQNYLSSMEAQLGVMGTEALTQVQRTQQQQQGVLDYQMAVTKAEQAQERAKRQGDVASSTAEAQAVMAILGSAGLDPELVSYLAPGLSPNEAITYANQIRDESRLQPESNVPGVSGELLEFGVSPDAVGVIEDIIDRGFLGEFLPEGVDEEDVSTSLTRVLRGAILVDPAQYPEDGPTMSPDGKLILPISQQDVNAVLNYLRSQ